MKWFKHMTCSGTDEKLAIVIDELGMEGYGFYWRLLEIIAEKLDAKGEPSCSYSIKRWSKIFGFYPKKFLKFINSFKKLSLIFCKTFENHSEMFSETSENILEISVPNLLKYQDNYSKNLQAAKKKRTSIEIEREKDIIINLSKCSHFDGTAEEETPAEEPQQGELIPHGDTKVSKDNSACPQKKIAALYAEILPELPQVRELRDDIQKNVRARWIEKQREKGFRTEADGLEYFRNFFTYVSNNNFLMGRADQNSTWRCDYRWLMKAANFDKVTSGYYARWQA